MSSVPTVEVWREGCLSDCDRDGISDHGRVARRIWSLVILLAIKDGAEEVRYEPSGEGRVLSYKIHGKEYELVPPPRFLAASLLEDMKAMSRWRGLRSLLARM